MRLCAPRVAAALVCLTAGCADDAEDSAPAQTGPLVVGRAPARTAGLPSVVTLEPQPPRTLPVPAEPAVMDQFDLEFVPRLLVARAGQVVEFRNGEDVVHMVRVVERAKDSTLFNVPTLRDQPHAYAFERTGGYAVSCDIHPGMVAFILVVSSPYAAVAEDNGDFSLTDVPPGSYTLTVWSADPAQRIERTVEITGERTELHLDASAMPPEP